MYHNPPPRQTRSAEAFAKINGSELAPNLSGEVYFKDMPYGVMVYVDVNGLPDYQPGEGDNPPIGPHGFHIHGMGDCTIANPIEPFMSSGGHYNPANQPHGNHAGDFPVLFSNNGYSVMVFFTNKFKVEDIIGKSVIIHQSPDDYRTQPARNSGKRLACGVIMPVSEK
jgi:Cu-Zn family superoxide dismutase